jgi:uncharacterized protein (TIGR02246 family)
MPMFIRALILAVLLSVPPTAAFAGPAEDANAVVDRWAAAFTANDADAVVKLYTLDAILLGTVSPIIAEGTAPIRDYFKGLPGSGTKVVIGDRRTVVLSDGAVLTTGFYEFTRIRDGKPEPTPARFTMIVVKRGDDWLIVHHHSSRRPPTPAQ